MLRRCCTFFAQKGFSLTYVWGSSTGELPNILWIRFTGNIYLTKSVRWIPINPWDCGFGLWLTIFIEVGCVEWRYGAFNLTFLYWGASENSRCYVLVPPICRSTLSLINLRRHCLCGVFFSFVVSVNRLKRLWGRPIQTFHSGVEAQPVVVVPILAEGRSALVAVSGSN